MKRTTYYLATFLLFSVTAAALADATNTPAAPRLDQYMETGMEVSGVRAPYYDEDGRLRAQLYGGSARMLEGGKADVTDLRIDVFEEGEEIMTVYAPQCFTQVVQKESGKVLSVESEGDVLIEMDDMTIIGRGFRFTSDSNRFEILSDARVLVQESAKKVQGLEL